MIRLDNSELKRKILNYLADSYKIKEIREPNHLSSYVYCRTKGFFDQKQAIEPTDEEVLLFALGYGLQDVLTPKSMQAPVYNIDGVIYRPDMSFTLAASEVENLIELKTTRRSAKYHNAELPETWLDYMKGGAKLRGVLEYDLIILYMMGNYSPPFPQLYAETITFEPEEIEENWLKLLARKKVMDNALLRNIPPTSYAHCYEWECKYCRYKLVCESRINARTES